MQEDHKTKILSFYSSKKRMPTYSEMMRLFGFKSKNAVYRLVNKFVEAGIVTKDHLGRLMPTISFGEIPLLGSVKAGFPSEVEAHVFDTVNLDEMLVAKKDRTYLLEVDGDSMVEAHIADGDLVLAERADKARDKEIVIAEVDGEFTMKYFRTDGKKVWLEAANKNYKPIYPTESFNIKAIVRGVIRKY